MKSTNHIRLKIALFWSAFFLTFVINAQVFGELLPGSSALIYDQNKGVHKLLDGANFIYHGNTIYADSAYYFEKNKQIRAYGNVHIKKSDNINLFCDSLVYRPNNIATLWGKVRAIDGQYKITTDSLDYNTKTEKGVYRQWGRIENLFEQEVLTSKVGYFYPNTKNFFFRTNVKYVSDQLNLETDSLEYKYSTSTIRFFGDSRILSQDAYMCSQSGYYNIDTKEGKLFKDASYEKESRHIEGDTLHFQENKQKAIAIGNVSILDTSEHIRFTGKYAEMDDSLKYSLIVGNAIIEKYQKDDTLFIRADTLYNLMDSLNQRELTLGYHNVKIFSKNIQGVGDSLSYAKEDCYMELYKNPILWANNGELKGDSIRVFIDDSVIYEAFIWNKATAIMHVDTVLNYYNQVGGTKMYAYFLNNEVNYAKVIGNAQTIFYPVEEQKTDTALVIIRKGMNRFYSSEIKIYFDSGEVVGVTYYQKPDGVFYPMDKIKKDEQLMKNFKTNFMLRPKSIEDLYE